MPESDLRHQRGSCVVGACRSFFSADFAGQPQALVICPLDRASYHDAHESPSLCAPLRCLAPRGRLPRSRTRLMVRLTLSVDSARPSTLSTSCQVEGRLFSSFFLSFYSIHHVIPPRKAVSIPALRGHSEALALAETVVDRRSPGIWFLLHWREEVVDDETHNVLIFGLTNGP